MFYSYPPNYQRWKYPIGILKELLAYYRFFDHPTIKNKKLTLNGIQSSLSKFRNLHEGKRCFLIANGPSLNIRDLSLLKDEITIGCNGIYTLFNEIGFKTTYYFTEDMEQTVLRGKDISKLNGVQKFCGLHNSHALDFKNGFNYFYTPIRRGFNHQEVEPNFTKDFPGIVFLGHTITYIMLQFAYFIGCTEVYIIGLDHDYGELPKHFPPGKIEITKENYEMVRKCHFNKDYYKIGDVMGVPNSKGQEKYYEYAKKVFEESGRKIVNVSRKSKLDIFKRDILEVILNHKIT